jgi:hypothetical protein
MAYINGNEVLFSAQLNGIVNVDQTYDPESENPQSGKAVAEAVAGVGGEWQLLNDITLTEAVSRIDSGSYDEYYKELWIEGVFIFETDYTSGKTGLFAINARSNGTTHTEYWSSITNGGTERLKAHCYRTPSGSLETTTFHSPSYYLANTPNTTAFVNRFDWSSGFDQCNLSIMEESGNLGVRFGVGTTLKIWGR